MKTSKLVAIEYAVIGALCVRDHSEVELHAAVELLLCKTHERLSLRTMRRAIARLGDRVRVTTNGGSLTFSIGRGNGISATDAECQRLASSPGNMAAGLFSLAMKAERTNIGSSCAEYLQRLACELLSGTSSVKEIRTGIEAMLSKSPPAGVKVRLMRAIQVIDGEVTE